MSDYCNTKIYQIVDLDTKDTYIGHTIQTLGQRLAGHVKDHQAWKNGRHNYVTSFPIIERGHYAISLIEDYPCENVDQARLRERFYIENTACVNRNIPGRSRAQYREENRETILQKHRAYNDANHDVILQKHRAYNDANRERIYEKKREKHECPCGGHYTMNNRHTHIKSKIHHAWLTNTSNEAGTMQLTNA